MRALQVYVTFSDTVQPRFPGRANWVFCFPAPHWCRLTSEQAPLLINVGVRNVFYQSLFFFFVVLVGIASSIDYLNYCKVVRRVEGLVIEWKSWLTASTQGRWMDVLDFTDLNHTVFSTPLRTEVYDRTLIEGAESLIKLIYRRWWWRNCQIMYWFNTNYRSDYVKSIYWKLLKKFKKLFGKNFW